jgi:hypothetical protein
MKYLYAIIYEKLRRKGLKESGARKSSFPYNQNEKTIDS